MAPVLCSQHLSNEIFSVEKKHKNCFFRSSFVSLDCSFGNNFHKRKLREHFVLNQKKNATSHVVRKI